MVPEQADGTGFQEELPASWHSASIFLHTGFFRCTISAVTMLVLPVPWKILTAYIDDSWPWGVKNKKQKHWCLGQTPRDSWLNRNDWSLGTSIFLYAPQGALLVAQRVKNLPANWETWVLLGRSPGGGHGNPLQYSCLENPHRQRSLAGYNPWSHKEQDTTEQLSTAQHEGFWAVPGLRITDLGNEEPLLTGALLGNEGLPSYTQKSSTSLPNGVSHSWEDVGPIRMGADNVLSMFSRSIYFFSCVWLFLTLWTLARPAFLSMEFSRQEYWSGSPVPFPFSRGSLWFRDWTQVSCIAGRFFTADPPRKPNWVAKLNCEDPQLWRSIRVFIIRDQDILWNQTRWIFLGLIWTEDFAGQISILCLGWM